MKKANFTRFFSLCLAALGLLLSQVAIAQCPAGFTQISVNMGDDAFPAENSWLLWDATAGAPATFDLGPETICGVVGTDPAPVMACVNSLTNDWVDNGSVTFCATIGNTYELYVYESFGDGWNGGGTGIGVTGADDGSGNGCGPDASNYIPFGNPAPSGNDLTPGFGDGGIDCTAINAGVLAGSFVPVCAPIAGCTITCPANIEVDTDAGVCNADLAIPDPVLSAACPAMGNIPSDFVNLTTGVVQLVVDPSNDHLDDTPLSITGVPTTLPACVADVTFEVCWNSDNGGVGFENPPLDLEGITSINMPAGGGDCTENCTFWTISAADYLAAAADGTLDFVIAEDVDVDINAGFMCAINEAEITLSLATACSAFVNDFNGGANASGVFPLGKTVVVYTANDGTQDISCSFCVIVCDNEDPALNCPADQTFNLLPGECEILVSWDVTAGDNCPFIASSFTGPFCDPCVDPSGGSALACGGGNNHIIQLIQIPTGAAGDAVGEVCFMQETFGAAPVVTINVYCDDGSGNVPFQGGTAVPFATQVYNASAADNGSCVCVPFDVGGSLPAGCTAVWVEVVTTGGTRVVNTPANCDGNAANGTNTFFLAPACGFGTVTSFAVAGFPNLDAAYNITLLSSVVPVFPDPAAPGDFNQTVPGEPLPIGVNCFQYITDPALSAQFTGSCSWCFTVNEFAGATTTLAANDKVQVSLSPDGGCTLVTADMVLEGGPYGCYDNFYMTRTPAYPSTPGTLPCLPLPNVQPGNCTGAPLGGQFGFVPIDCNDLGKTITVTIVDTATCSMAWTQLWIEDKVDPVITCDTVVVSCSVDDLTPGSLVTTNFTFPLDGTIPIAASTAGATFCGTIPVSLPPGATTAEALSLDLDISHTWVSDLQLDLTSPAGTTIRIFNAGAGCANNNILATFTDAAAMTAADYEAMCMVDPARTGTFQPADPFAAFAGEDFNGDWKISVTDLFLGDGGAVDLAGLTFNVTFPVQGPMATDNCTIVNTTFADDNAGGSCSTTSGTTRRTWTVEDQGGNTASCVQLITFERPSLDDVDFPSDIITLDCSSPYPDTFASVCVKDTSILIAGGGVFLPDGTTGLAFDIDPTAPPGRLLKDINLSLGLEHLNILETKLWLGRLDVDGNLIQTVKLFDPNPNLNYIKCSVNNTRDMMFTFDDQSCPMPHEACANFSPTLMGQYQPMESLNDGYAGLPVNAHANPDWVFIYADTVISCVLTGNVAPCSENMGNLTDLSIEYLFEDPGFVTGPTIGGSPFRSGDRCGLTATYTDEVIDVCPTSYKILRTWTIIDWCGADAATRTARFEQLIKVIDTCPPVLDNKRTRLNDNDTWDVPVYTPSTAAGAHTVCMGNATLPPASVCYENCSGVASWTTKLFTADGVNLLGSVPTNGGTFSDLTLDLLDMHDDGSPDDKNAAALTFPILATPNPFDSIVIPGISTLNEPDAIYLAVYEVVDACGNSATLECFVRLIDKIPPVPVCREETQIALTGFNGDTTTLCADDLDEGSYDNCGNVCFFIRKMVDEDDTDPIGNVDFGLGPDPSLTFEILGRDGAGAFDLARDFVYKNCTSFSCDDIGEDNQVFLLVVDDYVVNFINDYLDNLFPFIDAVVDYNQVPLTILPYDKLDDEEDIFDVSDPTNIMISADNDRHNRGKRFFEFYLNEDPNADGLFILPTAILWDGHFNFCMVNVHVEDKVRPTCTPPEDVWANCTDLPDNIDFTDTDQLTTLFGGAIADDNCGATIEELNPNVQLDLCGVGTIRRSFRAEDAFGNRSIGACRQTIMIMPVNSYKLNVPGDYQEECVNSGPQDFLYEEFACDLIAINSEDVELLASTDGECKKIIRTWSLINWCEYDGSSVATILPRLDLNLDGVPGDGNGGSNSPVRHNSMHMWVSNGDIMILNDNPNITLPSTGRYTYEQHIKIFDNTAPEVDYDGDVKFCGGDLDEDPCTAEVEITPNVTDFCTATSGRWELDAFSTRFFDADFSGNGGSLTGRWPLGVHTVRFYFDDECGNVSQFDVTFEAVDCKAPTPVCHNGLSIDVMPLSGMVELWAVDFDASSFDYCSPFDFRINKIEDRNGDGVITNDDYLTTLPADDFIILNCDDVNAGLTMVQLWVAEQDGTADDACVDNQDNDYCVTFVEVQDNNGVCGGPKVALGGKVTNEENESVENVTIDLNVQGMNTITTSNDGEYLFPSLPAGGDYSVTPMRNDDVDNGVSTYDLVLISKHVLNVDLLDSPYKVVAADANKSGNISTLDLVAIRKVILRVENQFPNNTSWRFVDKAYAFSTIPGAAGESFPEVKNYNNLASDQLAADFIAVKIGDVSGDAIANSILGVDDRTFNGTLNLNAAEATAVAGEEFTVEFVADKNVLGYQFTLDYNEKAVELVDIVDGLASEAQNFNVTNGMIATSWNNDVATSNEVMFSLVFRAKSDVNVMDIMTVSSELTKAEAYGIDGDLMNVALNFGGATSENEFALYQNTPNPFESETNIGFTLPEASSATITISDVAGKIVKVVKGDFAKGYNTVSLKRSDIGVATGVLSYQLETPTNSATKQMIIIE